MNEDLMKTSHKQERGTALVVVLLMLALLLAIAMGISLTSISELSVSNTYRNQTAAFQVAEAGLNHAVSLVANYQGEDFTSLLALRPVTSGITSPSPSYGTYSAGTSTNSTTFVVGGENPLYNPFDSSNQAKFKTGAEMIPSTGRQLTDATGKAIPNTKYFVNVVDNEPSMVSNYNPTPSPENANDNIDKDNRLVIYSTGVYENASITLEGWVAFLPFPALSAKTNIEIGGNTTISGSYGGVHSNSNLLTGTGGGDNWHVEQTATATGQLVGTFANHVDGFYGGGQPPLSLPALVTTAPLTSGGANTSPRLQEFLIQTADVILVDPGYADGAHETQPNGNGNAGTQQLSALAARLNVPYNALATALDSDTSKGNNVQQTGATALRITRDANGLGTPTRLASPADVGWSYNNASNPWDITSTIDPVTNRPKADGHTVFVVGRNNYNLTTPSLSTPNGGNVKLTGNIGQGIAAVQVTILATGSIDIQGNPNLKSNLTRLQTPLLPPFVKLDVLMAAVEDIRVRGDFNAMITFTGITFAGEQVDLSGNGSINGQVIAFGNNNVSGSLVEGPSGDRERNTITGSFVLTLNQGNAIGRIKLASWRQIKK